MKTSDLQTSTHLDSRPSHRQVRQEHEAQLGVLTKAMVDQVQMENQSVSFSRAIAVLGDQVRALKLVRLGLPIRRLRAGTGTCVHAFVC